MNIECNPQKGGGCEKMLLAPNYYLNSLKRL